MVKFILSAASSKNPLYVSPFFSSTVIIPPSASCKTMTGIPTPLFPDTDTNAQKLQMNKLRLKSGGKFSKLIIILYKQATAPQKNFRVTR